LRPVGAEGNKRCRQLRDQVIQDCAYNPESLFKLLLNTSQYEFNLKEVRIFLTLNAILSEDDEIGFDYNVVTYYYAH